MSVKLVTICNCPNCDTPINVPIRTLGQITRAMRKTEPTNEFMKKISRKGVLARKAIKAYVNNKITREELNVYEKSIKFKK